MSKKEWFWWCIRLNDIPIFNNSEFGSVRTLFINEASLFCGKDVAEALGYIDAWQAIRKNCKEEGVSTRHLTDSLGRQQETKFINESNLYRLIMKSKLPSAERFERWVFEEVLPAIRKCGSYSMTATRQLTTDDYLNASKIIATAKKETLPYVLDFLTKAGIEVAKLQECRLIKNFDMNREHESVLSYLGEHEVDGRLTNEVYKEYIQYCMNAEMDFVNNIVFSKQVNSAIGTTVIVRKVEGKSKRVFVLMLI